jgi:site-specific recombinase
MDPIVHDASASSKAKLPARVPRPELIRLIESFCSSSDLQTHYTRLIRLIRWLQHSGVTLRGFGQVLAFVDYLKGNDEVRTRFQANFGELLKHQRSISLLAESGIPSDGSLPSEIVQRLVGRVLPSARSDADAAKLLTALYSSDREARHFLRMPQEVFEMLVEVLTPANAPDYWEQQRQDLREALRLLATRVSSIGLRPEMRDRSDTPSIFHSPFYQLVSRTEEVMRHTSDAAERLSNWQAVVERCREEMATVHHHMESAGVSVDLVFDLKKIDACLTRMETLLKAQHAADSHDQLQAVRTLLERLIAGRLSDDSIRAYLRDNLNLLARKTVERTGRSGEHYIAYTKSEYGQMWLAAIGGGLLTVFTAAIKLRIMDAHAPLFVEGFAAGTNYAVSFVLLQIFHLVLATKQPAATAATFAGIVRDSRGVERSSKIAEFVARITRSQLAAAIGNVFAVSVGAVLFEKLWTMLAGQSYLSTHTAEHVYETLHPLSSGTAFYAIVTGVILWLAALAGGWCENFAVFYRLPEAIAQSPLGAHVGTARMKAIARSLDRNLAGWSTSIVLGYLLGFTPVIGSFFGLPLDVRHVTLSTGTLALAAAHFGTLSLRDGWLHIATLGICVIFVLNLSVSFLIAAMVALRAYNVRWNEQLEILRYLCKAAWRSPLRFVWPVDESKGLRKIGKNEPDNLTPTNQNAAAD